MAAILLSFLLLAYVVVPGVLFRRFFSFLVPLRRFQWSRTEEITASVISTLLPFIVVLFLVQFYWFGSYPLSFPDSAQQKWADYRCVLSASYSEKFFTDNQASVWQSVERALSRQRVFLGWFYLATIFEALLAGTLTFFYGTLRQTKPLGFLLGKFLIPTISEWYVMFTTFSFPYRPKRSVMVDILTADGHLYQGGIADYHVNHDGVLTGLMMNKARRFNRAEYIDEKKAGKAGPTDKYWRIIPGDSLYLLADKILNINFTYLPDKPLDEVAEDNLKKLNIDAHVAITSTPLKVEDTMQIPRAKDFSICPHCLANGRPGRVARIAAETPLVSRSDGRTYHLFLQFGPSPQPSTAGAIVPGQYLAHFRYALDSRSILNDPVTVLIRAPFEGKANLTPIVGKIADGLVPILEEGKSLAPFYVFEKGKLTELKVSPKK
jgi:hypothetical protein